MTAGAGAVATGAVGTAAAQGSTLVVNDFEGDPSCPDRNDLENWTGAGSFANGGGGTGEVSDGALRLEYDNAGWFGTNVNQDVGDYSRLEFVVRGDAGGEESHFTVNVGGTQTLLSELTDDSIGTEFSTVAVDLDDLGVSGSVSAIRLNFWQQNSGAIEIDTIRFASGSTSTPPPTETDDGETETDDGTDVEGQTVSVDLADDAIETDGSTEADVVLSEAPDGVSGFDLTVSVSDTEVATIDAVDLDSTEFSSVGDSTSVSSDGSSATVEAADLSQSVADGATDVTLATVTLAGEAEGDAEVSVDVSVNVDRLDDNDGNDIPVDTQGTSLSVGSGGGGDDEDDEEDNTGEQTVSVELADEAIEADDTTEAEVVLGEAPNGVSGYDLSVGLSDTDVAEIDSVSLESTEFQTVGDSQSVADDGSSATVEAADLSEAVQSGAADVSLATVTLTGEADVSVSVDRLDNDDGDDVSVSTESATLSVGPDTGGDGPAVSVDLSSESIPADGTTEAALTLAEAPDGVSGFSLSADVSNTDVATIEEITSGSEFTSPGESTSVSSDGSSATVSGADLSESVQSGATNVQLATVTLATHEKGETVVDVSVESMDDDDGDAMDIGAGRATLSVGETGTGGGVDPVNGVMPQDIDGDGLYEDLNGNGQVEFTDVIKFYYQRNDPAIQNNTDAYDFNGNGRIDLDDVVTLFRDMAENSS